MQLERLIGEEQLRLIVTWQREGRHAEAEAAIGRLLEIAPADARLHAALGETLAVLGRPQDAEASYRRALETNPDWAIVHYNLGNALVEQRRWEEAKHHFGVAKERMPGLAEAHYNFANVCKALGQLEEARCSYTDAIARNPDFAEAHNNLGALLADLGRFEEAEGSYRRALSIRPDHAIAWSNLGNALRASGQVEQAEAAYLRALALRPDFALAHNHLANAQRDLGQLADAERSYRTALEIDPESQKARSNLLFLLNYVPGRSAAEIFADHQQFGQRYRDTGTRRRERVSRTEHRKLRIGYMSGDLREHAVAYFIEPVLARHNRNEFEISCYYNFPVADAVTQRLKAHADNWRDIAYMDDHSVARQIENDQIDILVDLSGHTAHNRLPVFALRPAPVQATWLGYLNTTGMTAIDYRITDIHATPPGILDACHSEALIRLPDCQWCYQPPAVSPEVSSSPTSRGGRFSFAVFTSPPKVNDETIVLWRQMLDRVPGARLLVLYGILRTIPNAQWARFARHGIGPDRLELVGSKPFAQYLDMHRFADLMLDTWPYTGGTTTCHALWMGVPVVTLAGTTATSRGGASLLRSVGLAELVAESAEAYVGIASDLAADKERLQRLRAEMRTRVAGSALTDGKRFTANLEVAYRGMWVKYRDSRG